MDDSLITRCAALMRAPRATFDRIVRDPKGKDIQILSALLGWLIFARAFGTQPPGSALLNELLSHPFWMVFLTVAAGFGPIYFSAWLLSALIRLVDRVTITPIALRAVFAYSLGPFLLALFSMILLGPLGIPGVGMINLGLILWSWALMIIGIMTVARFSFVKATFIFIIPLASMFLILSLAFKFVSLFFGEGTDNGV